MIVGGASQTVSILDAKTLQTIQTLHGHDEAVCSVHFRADRLQAVSCDRGGSVKVWSLETEQGMAELPSETEQIADACFSPSGDWLACAEGVFWGRENPGVLEVWNTHTGQRSKLAAHTAGVFGVAFLPGKKQLVSVGADGAAIVWDLEKKAPVKTFDAETPLRSVSVSNDGQWMVTGGEQGQVILWNLHSGSREQVFTLRNRWTESVAISANGLLVTGADGLHCKVWKRTSGEVLLHVEHPDLRAVVFNHAGTELAIGTARNVQIYDTYGWEKLTDMIAHRGPIVGLAFGPDDGTLASRAEDGTVKLWDLATMQSMLTLNANSRSHHRNAPVFSPSGDLIFADHPQDSGAVRLWSTRGPIVPPKVVDGDGMVRRISESFSIYQQWSEAYLRYERVLTVDPKHPGARIDAAYVAYMLGDAEKYNHQATAAFALARELPETEVRQRGRLVRVACLMPGAVDDLDEAIKISTDAWQQYKTIYDGLALLFALMRAERNEELLERSGEVEKVAHPKFGPDISIVSHFKSIAMFRLGNMDEANEMLAKGNEAFTRGMPRIGTGNKIPTGYFDWFVAAIAAKKEANQVASELPH
ncbi:WD40 repeat domain-containing protein [Rubripirellula tenax]|uniref:WD40 repeat domain-containing protein n=1 Tax=Rubripirellula tenax TaxID=2528015 RepID=UPI001646BB16|nr:WD40 repeat domain-containing protein [Rubripirellula tenax]